jgi:NAD-reducing hydrogenase large subunit
MAETKKITIYPVTRIEGHAKITIHLDAKGEVEAARFHVNEFRGFEKFCEGRYFTEMPNITPRICGICPHSHAIASAKAGEAIMGVKITPAAKKLRKLIELGQFVSSHALSFFHLSAPDFLLGFDSDPAQRNVLGLAAKMPDVALKAIRLRKYGQEISERITGKKIHVKGIVAGGMGFPLTEENRKALLAYYPEVIDTSLLALDIFKKWVKENKAMVDAYAPNPTLYMSLVGKDDAFEIYEGALKFVDADGKTVAEGLDPQDFLSFVAEKPIDWSYLKYPYYKPYGEGKGFYRVGPLARLNVVKRMTTPLAQKAFEEYKAFTGNKPVHGALYYHYARLIELIAAVELCKQLLEDPDITSTDILVEAKRNHPQGVGCAEAPRGTLFHHYQVDEGGALTKVNLVIATGQNNPSMDRSVLDVAKQFVKGPDVKEGALNRVEAAIRCYDPCLSCATHALGSMPMQMEILDASGAVVNTVSRG